MGWNLLAASCQDVQALAMQVCLERQEILGKEAENYWEMRWVKVDIQNYISTCTHYVYIYIGSDTVSQDVRHDFSNKIQVFNFRIFPTSLNKDDSDCPSYIPLDQAFTLQDGMQSKGMSRLNSTACLQSNLDFSPEKVESVLFELE